jgi:endonuclease/exonuclease/phosphatase family metal-dependent hydrolase
MFKVGNGPVAAILYLGLMVLGCQEPDRLAGNSPEQDDGKVSADPGATNPKVTAIPEGAADFLNPVSAGAGSGSEALADPDLKFMSFNIRYNNSGDGENAWPNRREQVYALIKAQDPDLLGMQEVLNGQLNDLKANVPGYTSLGVGRDDGKTAGEYSPIWFRTARFRVDTSGTFWFSDTPAVPGSKTWGNTTTRICTWARLVDKAKNQGFYHFNLHIDHLNEPSRQKSMLLLVERIGQVKYPAEPFFVTGDFNSGETSPVIQFMKGKQMLEGKANPRPLRDSYREFDSVTVAVATRHDFTGDPAKDDKIDYIWIQPRIKTLKAEILRQNVAGRYPSDHFPITAWLTVPDWAGTSIKR